MTFFMYFLNSGCFIAQAINQPKPVQQANIGASVTIECHFLKKDFNLIVWYKQLLGKKLQHIAMSYYRNNVHFLKGFDDGCLKDVATYYCGVNKFTALYFSPGTFLMITSIKILQQTHLKPVNFGDNITLQCTVQFMEGCKCVGNHSVYWFRHESGDTHAGIIYKHGNMNDQCEKSSEKDSHVQSCIYNLSKKNLGLSDAGTYYCAVATCGEILFGNGSRLEIGGVYMNPCLRGTYCLSMVFFLFILPLGNQGNALSATCWQRVNLRLIQFVCCFCFMWIFFMHSFTLCYLFI
uniref:Ig-like domain-containing protein n=1 Tax=Sinocyclocheilus anshuiensis TaxID=1608454 RepID=A0A671SPQ0_9TELE